MKRVLVAIRGCGHVAEVCEAPTVGEEIPESMLNHLVEGDCTLAIIDIEVFREKYAATMLCDCK